jgi:osmotically inducible lipoprotein OsmB
VVLLVLSAAGCANLTPTQQRAVTGGAIGTAAGATIGAMAGSAAVGAAQAAKGIAGNAKAIHDLAHLVVTDQDPQRIKAFQHLAYELEEHAGKLEAAARARDAQELRTQVSEVLEYCLACHQQFRD